MLDHYLIGDHLRNSPEADVPLINLKDHDYRLGGAANVAMNIQALKLKPTLVSILGKDTAGEKIKLLCDKNAIEGIWFELPNRITTEKQRVVDRNFKQFLRIDQEETQLISAEEENDLIQSLETLLRSRDFSALIIQDYNKGMMSIAVINALLEISQEMNLPMFVDPKADNFKALSNCTIFKPNLKELSTQLGQSIEPTIAELKSAITRLELKSEFVVVTLAEKGLFYYSPKTDKIGLIPGFNVENADVSGAGDSVLSALVYAYLKKLRIEEIASFANKVGAQVCSQRGISQLDLTNLA